MALGYNIVGRGAFGDMFVRLVDLTLDNAYAAGGWTLDPQALGFGKNGVILAAIPVSDGTGAQAVGRFLTWDRTTGKLLCRDASGAANAASPEISTVTQMNNIIVRFLVLGKGQG